MKKSKVTWSELCGAATLGFGLSIVFFSSFCDFQSERMKKAFKSECKFFLEAVAKGGKIPKELAAGSPAMDSWEQIHLINKRIDVPGYNRKAPFREAALERYLMALPVIPGVAVAVLLMLLTLLLGASFLLRRHLDGKKSFMLAYSIILFVFVFLLVISSAQSDVARFDQEYKTYAHNINELIDNGVRLDRQDGVKYFRKYLLATAEGRLSVPFLNEVLGKYLKSENKERFLWNLQLQADGSS